jgi:Family of unknown function (DUF6152)
MTRILIAAMTAVVLAGASLSAHHSFAAEFDINKPVTLQGTVTKVEWVNPHVYVYLDVKDASGKVTPWSLSSLGPAAARRAGVTRANFGQGQTVTILGYHAKDGSNFAFMRKMTFADGHSVELWLGDDAAKQ